MAFKAQTIRTKGIGPGVYPPVGQEFFIMLLANEALHLVARVQKAKELQANAAKKLEILSWHKPDKEGNNSFHDAY